MIVAYWQQSPEPNMARHQRNNSNRHLFSMLIIFASLTIGCRAQSATPEDNQQSQVPAPHAQAPRSPEPDRVLQTLHIEGPTYRGQVTQVSDDGTVEFRELVKRLVLEPRSHVVVFVSGNSWTEKDPYRAHLTVAAVEQPESERQIVKCDVSVGSRVKPGDHIILFVADPAWKLTDLVSIDLEGNRAPALLGYRHEVDTAIRLRSISIAVGDFFEKNRYFPPSVIYGPDGSPWHSWRVLLLPYLNEESIFDAYDFNEPWNGPKNRKLIERIPAAYQEAGNPSRFSKVMVAASPKSTDALASDAFHHSHSLFPLTGPQYSTTQTISELLRDWGERGPSIRFPEDGLANTIAVGIGESEEDIAWTQPLDLQLDERLLPLGAPGSFAAPYQKDGIRYGLLGRGDGVVVPCMESVPAELLRSWVLFRDRGRVARRVFDDEKWKHKSQQSTFGIYSRRSESAMDVVISRRGSQLVGRIATKSPKLEGPTVAGSVTFEGEPVLSGTIQFVTQNTSGAASGRVAAAGKIVKGRISEVATSEGGNGLPPGTYLVLVNGKDVEGLALPPEFNSPESSDIQIQIGEDEPWVDLEIALEL